MVKQADKQHVSAQDAHRQPINIVLFSDGTGNSSRSADKTNVWRMYEALDLGYPAQNKANVQVAYYDDGVGTESVRFLALAGGVFGFGLARNIRDIYKFLCRNYREGDRIYAFGFSRGAYTIRLLVALVTTMGLVKYTQNEGELDLAARDMWREFRRGFHANNAFADLLVTLNRWLTRCVIRVKRTLLGQMPYASKVPLKRRSFLGEWWEHTRDKWVGWWRREYPSKPAQEYGPEIEFLGVWDTVAAYGGPIVELTRAIDEWIWPLTMPDYRLSEKVKVARHALAIDDKRDSFTPLLWDEIHEKEKVEKAGGTWDRRTARLRQVWFAGMHSDVGGGYPDDSLAYVSLYWMLEQAEDAGMRFLKIFRERIETFRNVYGPIHNSRGGAGVSYRYQPRYINAWVNRPGGFAVKATQTLRDPTIDHGRYRFRGLLEYPVLLHKSVEERLQVATDGYGPNNLPALYEVDNGKHGIAASQALQVEVGSDNHRNLEACIMSLGDRIKLRRFWYFCSFWAAFALFLKPWWPQIWGLRELVGTVDVRINTGLLEDAANAFLPSVAKLWTDAIFSDPWGSGIVLAVLLATNALGSVQEGAMADTAGKLWRQRLTDIADPAQVPATGDGAGLIGWLRRKWQALAGAMKAWLPGRKSSPDQPQPEISPPHVGIAEVVPLYLARWFHTNDKLAGGLAIVKWHVLPLTLGFAIWLFNWYLAFAVFAQASLQLREPSASTCDVQAVNLGSRELALPPVGLTETRKGEKQIAVDHVFRVDISNPCSLLYAPKLDKSTSGHFHIGVELVDAAGKAAEWRDASIKATPEGWSEKGLGATLLQWAAKPYLRVMTADLFQPIIEFRRAGEGGFMGADGVFMLQPRLKTAGENYWAGEFDLPSQSDGDGSSQIAFFLNDAYYPIDFAIEGKGGCQQGPEHWWQWPGRINWSGIFQHRGSQDIAGRYANNCGTAVVHIIEMPFEHPVIDQRVEAIGEQARHSVTSREGKPEGGKPERVVTPEP